MRVKNLSEIRKLLILNFSLIILINPVVNMALLYLVDTTGTALKKTMPLRIFSLLIYAIMILIYSFITNKLQRIINTNNRDESSVKFVSKFPVKVSILFFVPMLICTMGLTLIANLSGIMLTPLQLVFYFIKDIILALSLAMYHYYRLKIIIYPVTAAVGLRSLSIFEKLLAPIYFFISIALLFVAFSYYAMRMTGTVGLYKTTIMTQGDKSAIEIDRIFGDVEVELKSYLNFVNPSGISQAEGYAVAKKLVGLKINKNIESLYVSKLDGNAYTSSGKVIKISDRDYFIKALSDKTTSWSELLDSRDTGSKIIACSVPYLVNGKVSGVIGATINTDSMKQIIDGISGSNDTKFFLMNDKAKIIYHPDNALIGRIIKVDNSDKGTVDFLKENDSGFHNHKFNKRKLMLRKIKLGSTGHYLVSASYQDFLVSKVNPIILNLTFAIVLLSGIIFFMLYRIGRNFSAPIRNSINVFRKLSDGDLTARVNDYLPDEFGDMIINMKKFQKRIRDVVDSVLNSSNQLAASSEELSATSSSLADSAQTQAAAVEEATASLEEISASNESIADNSKVQSDQARETYRLIKELGELIKTVNDDAGKTLKVANDTTSEAVRGSELMQNTIAGMKSLDDNSRKIADIVSLISDISDQVNLLALNAAIEAARAGEHGRGFAVVADEISKLAEQTADSAKSITGLVMNGVNAAKKGIEEVGQTSKALDNIIAFINNTKELVQKIAHSTEIQSKAGDEVTKATRLVMEMSDNISNSTQEQTITHQEITKTMDQINTQTQQQASGAEEIASSAEEISAQAEGMKNKLEFFKI